MLPTPLSPRRVRHQASSRPLFRPALEVLEDRRLLSVFDVTSLTELRAAVVAANSQGGSNTINMAAGLYQFGTAGELGIQGNLTINGAGARGTVIDANQLGRVFQVFAGSTVQISDVTIENGISTAGGGIFNSGNLTLTNVVVTQNTAIGARGQDGNGLSTFATNGTPGLGGGIFNNGGSVTVNAGVFSFDAAQGGDGGNDNNFNGGIGNVGGAGAAAAGGAIYNAAHGTLILTDTFLGRNFAQGGQGGRGGDGSSRFAAGGAGGTGGSGEGGAIFNDDGSATLHNVTLDNNTAAGGRGGSAGNAAQGGLPGGVGGTGGQGEGGAVFNDSGTLHVDGGSMADNEAQGGFGGFGGNGRRGGDGGTAGQGLGGGVGNATGTVSVTGTLFEHNLATGGSGGTGGSGQVGQNSGQNGNNGAPGATGGLGGGGGMFSNGGQVSVTGTVFHLNKASGGDGGNGGFTFVTQPPGVGGAGGEGIGGAVIVSGGTFSITQSQLDVNDAFGGRGGAGGSFGFFSSAKDQPGIPNGAPGGAGGTGGGGGIGIIDGSLNVDRSTLFNNEALGGLGGFGGDGFIGSGGSGAGAEPAGGIGGDGMGGGLVVGGGSATVTNTSMVANIAFGSPGGFGGNVLRGSGAPGGAGGRGLGGGINIGDTQPHGSLILTNVLLNGNDAAGSNGGKGGNGPAGKGFSGNDGIGTGGGFFAFSLTGATAQLTNVTITDNQVTAGNHSSFGGTAGIVNDLGSNASIHLKNTLVARNSFGAGVNGGTPDVVGAFQSDGFNLIGVVDGSSSSFQSAKHDQFGTAASPLDPLLGNLAGPAFQNDFPFARFAFPLPGSPAIDGGTATGAASTDIRGKPRNGAVDIGAFENQGFTLKILAGDNQVAQKNSAFDLPLMVGVDSADGLGAISGGLVTFTAPGSGASAVLSRTTAVAIGGIASVNAVANATTGSYEVTATTPGAASPVTFHLTNVGIPAAITITGGDGQSTSINEEFAQPLQVLVTDEQGNPIVGIPVFGAVPDSGPSGTFTVGGQQFTEGSLPTDANGLVTVNFTANGVAGSYHVFASVSGLSTPAVFTLTNVGLSVQAVRGDNQAATINTTFGQTFRARVVDGHGNPMSGVPVTFTAPDTGASGTFSTGGNTATAVTDDAGMATAPAFLANDTPGGYEVVASAPDVTQTAKFALTNDAAGAASISLVSGDNQVGIVNSGFSQPLIAYVTDSNGNPAVGVSVTFQAPAAGPSGTFPVTGSSATVFTDSAGIATVNGFQANNLTGSYTVSATVAGGPSVNFHLTNALVNITALAGDNQAGTTGRDFGLPFVVAVMDNSGPVAGVNVTFQAPITGASGTFAGGLSSATVTTNSSGIATSPTFTANASEGSYAVTATVNGAPPVSFNLTNTDAFPAKIALFGSAAPLLAPIHTPFQGAMIQVLDNNGNPMNGVTVTFTAPGTGASGTFNGGSTTATAVTSGFGVAFMPLLTANDIVGPFTVTASIPSLDPVSIQLANTVSNAGITPRGGNNQNATVNTDFADPLSVVVRDISGNLVAGVPVTFKAVPGAGVSFPGGTDTDVETTDGNGMATSKKLTASGAAGFAFLQATAPGYFRPAFFLLARNDVGAAASVAIAGGNEQNATVNTDFAQPLKVVVQDAAGNPRSGVSVRFTISVGSGSFPGGTITDIATSDANGIATSKVISAGSNAGGILVVAGVDSSSGEFVAGSLAFTLGVNAATGEPASMTVSGGDSQTVQVNATFPTGLKVVVKDGAGNPLSGVPVTFTGPESGPSGFFGDPQPTITVNTDATGTAATTFTANDIPGSYQLEARVNGVAAPTVFQMTNSITPIPESVSVQSGDNQAATVGTGFAQPLAVLVKDNTGNPAAGITVTFTAPSSGAGGTFADGSTTTTAVTNSAGIATVVGFQANAVAGSFSVNATVEGVGTPGVFHFTSNPPPAAAGLSLASGDNQSAITNSFFQQALQVLITDGSGRPIGGKTVTFTAPATGPGGAFATGLTTATAVTSSDGVATVVIQANGTVGGFTVNAAVAGVGSPVVFHLSTEPPPPVSPPQAVITPPATASAALRGGTLFVQGGADDEVILFVPGKKKGQVRVLINGRLLGVFRPKKIVALGGPGNDIIKVDRRITIPASLDGGSGVNQLIPATGSKKKGGTGS